MHQLIIDDELKRAGVTRTTVATQCDRRRLGGAHDLPGGQRVAEGAVPRSDLQRRRGVVPAVQRTRLGLRPRGARHASRARRRRVRDQRVEDLVERRAPFDSSASSSPAPTPTLPKHKGISYFIVPMDLPGITLSPIVDMTTAHSFNQTFFDDVRLPAEYLRRRRGRGLEARQGHARERTGVAVVGRIDVGQPGPSASHLLDLVRANGRRDRPDRPATARSRSTSSPRCCGSAGCARSSARLQGQDARRRGVDPEDHGRRARPARDGARQGRRRRRRHDRRVGTGRRPPGSGTDRRHRDQLPPRRASPYPDVEPVWHYGYLFSPALTVGGGTFAVQRNIIAEQVLGLPRDINVEQGLTWSETRRPSA